MNFRDLSLGWPSHSGATFLPAFFEPLLAFSIDPIRRLCL
jgi:hypothetical protein